MDLDDQLREYFGTANFAEIPAPALAAGVERMQVDLGLEKERGRRFALLGGALHAGRRTRPRCRLQGRKGSGRRPQFHGHDGQPVLARGLPVRDWRRLPRPFSLAA